jgi:glycosyltransferase involved in cell wall biosynthesis
VKLGIVQNKIFYGGRLAVIVGICEALNQRGIVPDLITFQTDISPDGIYRRYGNKINFKICRLNSALSKIPGEANILAFNLALHRIYKKYDYFINSNNTTFLMPSQIPTLSYIHFPRIARLKSSYLSIHHPDGPHKEWRKPKSAFLNLLGLLYSFHRVKNNNYVVANSKFSRLYFQHYYPAYKRNIPIIYPPVKNSNNQVLPLNMRPNTVCSIGQFCAAKNQLGQICVAEQLPDWKFTLIGFADEKNTYLNDCESYVKMKKINNVEFEVNVSLKRKHELLRLAKYFIHPNINEPFGISTAEAILNGCLPLVHDSGGQREIVPFEDLRFDVLDEIPSILAKLSKCDTHHLIRLQNRLIRHCLTHFSYKVFKEKMDAQVRHIESAKSQALVSSMSR